MLKSYQELKVWQRAHELTLKTYQVTQQFPKEERFGLTSQIRRSAVSTPANIAEGYGRKHTKEYIQMLYISQGSLEETKYHFLLSRDLRYLKNDQYKKLIDLSEEVGRMLRGLIKSLERIKTKSRR